MFLGVKGVYYEIIAPGQSGELVPVRWLESYDFQQHVPHDVDFRILLTFLELYRTLIGFVLYKLYTEENLVYPPPVDKELDERGEVVGALKLVEKKDEPTGAAGSKVSKKEVKRAIKGIRAAKVADVDEDMEEVEESAEEDEEFVERPTNAVNEDVSSAPLTTYSSLVTAQPTATQTSLLFSPYTFYLSRETSSKTWEFVVRALGGRIISSLDAPSPDATPLADTITHVICDRPMTAERIRELQGDRKWLWVQPQWVADCVNKGKVIAAAEYAPGQLLPPHLSPWEGEGELSRPWLEENADAIANDEQEEDDELPAVNDESSDEEEEDTPVDDEDDLPAALLAAAQNPTDPTLVHAADLEAERNGTSHAAFQTQLKAATKALAGSAPAAKAGGKGAEDDLRKIMMSNKKAKLYEKIQFSNKQKSAEVSFVRLLLVFHIIMGFIHEYLPLPTSRADSCPSARGPSIVLRERVVYRPASNRIHSLRPVV